MTRAPGRLLRRRLDGRRGRRATPSYFELQPRRPRQGHRRLPRAPRRRRHRPPADPAAHGTGFDRIGAFAEGFEQRRSSAAPTTPTSTTPASSSIVEVPFTDQDDFERGGNLPLDELGPSLLADLEHFWTRALRGARAETWTPVDRRGAVRPRRRRGRRAATRPTRGDVLVDASFYCVDDDTIYLDGANLVPALNEIGDYAVATEIARQYAFAAQVRLGDLENTLGDQPPGRLPAPASTRRSGFSANRERGPGALPVARRPRRGRDRVPPHQRRSADGRTTTSDVGRHGLPALRRLPRRLPAGHRRLRRPRSARASGSPARARRDWRTTHSDGTADRDHHQGRAARAAAPRRGRPPRWGAWPRLGRGMMSWRRHRPRSCSSACRPGPPQERSARGRRRAIASTASERDEASPVRRRRRLGAKAAGRPGRRRACASRRGPTATGRPRCAAGPATRPGWRGP